jgi:hypothetical protein
VQYSVESTFVPVSASVYPHGVVRDESESPVLQHLKCERSQQGGMIVRVNSGAFCRFSNGLVVVSYLYRL